MGISMFLFFFFQFLSKWLLWMRRCRTGRGWEQRLVLGARSLIWYSTSQSLLRFSVSFGFLFFSNYHHLPSNYQSLAFTSLFFFFLSVLPDLCSPCSYLVHMGPLIICVFSISIFTIIVYIMSMFLFGYHITWLLPCYTTYVTNLLKITYIYVGKFVWHILSSYSIEIVNCSPFYSLLWCIILELTISYTILLRTDTTSLNMYSCIHIEDICSNYCHIAEIYYIWRVKYVNIVDICGVIRPMYSIWHK